MSHKPGGTTAQECQTDGGSLPALVDPAWLLGNLDNPDVVVLEVTRDDEPVPSVVSGALRVHWRALNWHSERREIASPELVAERLGALGVTGEKSLVLVGDPIQFATYTYWVLTMAGRHNVGVLDGAKQFWLNAGLPTSEAAKPQLSSPHPIGQPDQSSRIGRDEVLSSLGTDACDVVDLRTEDEYVGLRVAPYTHPIDHGAQVHGRIPGARHVFYQSLLTAEGRFLEAETMRSRLVDAGVTLRRPVTVYCRMGHRASLGWFALSRVVGFTDVRVYDGSWTEWGSMVGMPVEREARSGS